jgi:chaperonin GroES
MTTTPTRPISELPITLLHDRVLVRQGGDDGERRSSGGIVIPATAQVGRRLAWARVVALGPNVRTMEVGDRVLFEPEERGLVEIQGVDYVLLRERDIHAVASENATSSETGLYL